MYIPDDLYRDLMLLVKTSGLNFSQLIREGAEGVVKREKAKRVRRGFGKNLRVR